jgi:GntR family transcriptional regulator
MQPLSLIVSESGSVTETLYHVAMGNHPVSLSVAWEPLAITGGTDIELPHGGLHAGRAIVPRFDAFGYHVDLVESPAREWPSHTRSTSFA